MDRYQAAVDRAEQLRVANTILVQLGGQRFLRMTGATNLVADTDSLRFRIPRANRINFVIITLLPSDTYRMEFKWVPAWRGQAAPVVATRVVYEDVYCDQLEELFTQATGLYTRL